MSIIDLNFADGIAVEAVTGAEQALAEASPLFAAGWAALQAVLPGATLEPLFAGADGLAAAEIQDLADAARMAGEDPPDLLRWFAIECPEESLEIVLPLVTALAFVEWAGPRPQPVPAALRDGTVSWGTDPLGQHAPHLRRSPFGVDALHAWRIDGGSGLDARVADIESGWALDHEDLLSASITRRSVFGTASAHDIDHGTSVAGILVATDNGVGTVGVVPDARLLLVSDVRATGKFNLAEAIYVAARAVGRGGVLLIEDAYPTHPPEPPPAPGLPVELRPDVLVEANPPDHAAISFAVRTMGVTVIEPAGNRAIDLDNPVALPPEFSYLQLRLPSILDSGAIVVGAGSRIADPEGWGTWINTVRGGRVDCFAPGSGVPAPFKAPVTYRAFTGTSAASAVIAGVASSMHSMASAAGHPLRPVDVRDLLRNPALGTPLVPGYTGIRAMPDLRRIARTQRWPRVLPVAAAAVSWDSAVLVYLDDDDYLVRRHYSFFTGWGRPLPPVASYGGNLWPAQPAVFSLSGNDGSVAHVALASGDGGVHRLNWDSSQAQTDLDPVATSNGFTTAHGTSVATVLARQNVVVLVGIDNHSRLIAMRGDPHTLGAGIDGPVVLSGSAAFRRSSGPAAASLAPETMEAVAIADGGTLLWFRGTLAPANGMAWSGPFSEPTNTAFVPGARVAALAVDGRVLVAAVGDQGWLHCIEIAPTAGAGTVAFLAPVVVDVTSTIATQGPLALARLQRSGLDLVVLFAVDTDGFVRVATRPAAGGAWSPLLVVPCSVRASPLGGVTAISSPDLGVMAFVVDIEGRIRSTSSRTAVDWNPLRPMAARDDDPWPILDRNYAALASELFNGDPVLEAVVADQDRISRSRNSPGPAVTKIQQALLSWDPACLPMYGADGMYGEETADQVRRFKWELLAVPASQVIDDVGPATVRALDRIQAAAEGRAGARTTLQFTNEYGEPLANLHASVSTADQLELLTTDAGGRAVVHLPSTGRLEIDAASALHAAGDLLGREWPPAGGFAEADAMLTPAAPASLNVEPGANVRVVIATRVNLTATLVAPLQGNLRVDGPGTALQIGPEGEVILALQATGGAPAAAWIDPPLMPGPLPEIPPPAGWTPVGTYTIRTGDTAQTLSEAFVGDPDSYAVLSDHPPVAGEVLALPETPAWLSLATDPLDAAGAVLWFTLSPDEIVAAVLAQGDPRPLQDVVAVLDRPPAAAAAPLSQVMARTQALAAISAQTGAPIGPDREPEVNL